MYRQNTIALFLIIAGFSFNAFANTDANTLDAVIESITPASDLQQVCVDTAPLNDGYGWNGTCSCRLPAEFELFGNSLLSDGKRVVIGSTESPHSCEESGSASVYRIESDGSVVKEAELVSSTQETSDGFASDTNEIAFSGDYLAITGAGVTVFKFDGSVWNELYVVDGGNRARSPSLAFFEEELFVQTAEDTLLRLNKDDGTLIQTISLVCPDGSSQQFSDFDLSDEFLAIRVWLDCGRMRGDSTRVFRKSGSGEYLQDATFDTSLELSSMADGKKLLYGIKRTEVDGDTSFPIYSWLEADDGSWVPMQALSRNSSYTVHEGQLFLKDTTYIPDGVTTLTPYLCCFLNVLKIYELDTNNGNWVEKQTLDFRRDSVGRDTAFSFSGNQLSVVRSQNNWFDGRPMEATATVFEKDGTNQWRFVFEEEFIGPRTFNEDARFVTSSSFAGNNLFLSVKNNEVRNIRFGQNSVSLTDAGTCDYSNAHLHDGWGWNNTTQTACPPDENQISTTGDNIGDNGNDDSSDDIGTGNVTGDNDSSDESGSGNDTGNDGSNTSGDGSIANDAVSADPSDSTNSNITQDSESVDSGGGAVDMLYLCLLVVVAVGARCDRRFS